jgi:hydrogenase expression/formation protein HypD
MGFHEYPRLSDQYRVPIVVTGFEPLDILDGIRRAIIQLETGQARAENAYGRAVTFNGNRRAQDLIDAVFESTDRDWRGIGTIPASGWKLRDEYRDFDAQHRFPRTCLPATEAVECRSGEVLQGRIKPSECPRFGNDCTPQTPLGATMVSSEGACAAYFHAGRHLGLGRRGSGSDAPASAI